MHCWFSLYAWCQLQLRQLAVGDIVRLEKLRVSYGAGSMTYLQQHLLLQWQPRQLQHQQCLELMTDGGRSTPVAAAVIACRFEALAVLAATAGRSSLLARAPVAHCKLYVTIDKLCASCKEHHIAIIKHIHSKAMNRPGNRCSGYTLLTAHQQNLHWRGE